MDKIANVLLEREVLDAEDFAKLMSEGDKSEKEKIDREKSEPETTGKTGEKINENEKVDELPEIRIDKLPNTNHDFLA